MHPSVKRALTFVVAFVTVFSISQTALVRSAEAHNVDSWQWCNQNFKVCTSTNHGGGGLRAMYGPGQGYCSNVIHNDQVSGIDSHIGVPVHFWEDAGCNGIRRSYAAYALVSYVGGAANDRFSSVCIGAWTETFCAHWD